MGRSSGLGQGSRAQGVPEGSRKVAIFQQIWERSSFFTTVLPYLWQQASVHPAPRNQAAGGGMGKGWGPPRQGFAVYKLGERHFPYRRMPKSHWAKASHMTTANCKGQASEFSRPLQSGQAKLASQVPVSAAAYHYGLGRTQ